MLRWIPYVMVRIVGFFIAGILLAVYEPEVLALQTASYFLIILVIIYVITFFLLKNRKLLSGIIGLPALFIAGYVHLLYFTDSNYEDHLIYYFDKVEYYEGVIVSAAEEKENSLKYELKLTRINRGKDWIAKRAKILVYIKKHPDLKEPVYGDRIIVKGSPLEVAAPSNPHEFDYKRFLGFRNVYHQHFIGADQYRPAGSVSTKGLYYYSIKARSRATTELKTYIPGLREQAIALALTLGVKEGIDNELQKAYASSGAMHVLAVSGLHVGIIYGLILLIFKPLKSRSWTEWVVALVSILLLWAYAFITGLSPSVLRAVTMFSFIAIAGPFGRSTNIYNTLAGSAFLLLIFNPYLIMSVGFQLSYLAVLGIVTIHRPLYMLFVPKYSILDWIWNISCVSIAAQLATFSLGILYFHQFPVYFLFSNLFVIPGAILILVGSISTILASFAEPIALLSGKAVQGLIKLLNAVVFMVEEWPFSLIEHIYLTTFQCGLLIVTLIFFILLLKFKKFQFLVVSLILTLTFSISQWFHFFNEVRDERFVIYNISGHTAIECIANGVSVFYSDQVPPHDKERIKFHITPNRLFCSANTVFMNSVGGDNPGRGVEIFKFQNKTIGIISERITLWPEQVFLDFLVISNNSIRAYDEAMALFNFDKMILDSSNPPPLSVRIEGEANPDVVYNVRTRGAFINKF